MKTEELNKILALISVVVLATLVGCKDDTPITTGPEIPESTLLVNEFIYENMSYFYLWNEQMPDIDYEKQEDPEKYFDTLLNKPIDRWSFITDDYQALAASYEGIVESMGHSFELHYYSNSESEIYGIIQFVYPNTPASEAGLKRGDFFTAINGTDLTDKNYITLLDQNSYTLTIAQALDGVVTPVKNVNLTARVINESLILLCDTILMGGKTIGYLAFKNFYDNHNDSLYSAFQWLQSANIDELVLDLRYNNGGTITSMQYLASLIAPIQQINKKDIILKTTYNSILTSYYKSMGSKSTTNFRDDIGLNLNMNNLYVLTGRNTASASEALIVGLDPYMNVTTIGDTTHGKYTGAFLLFDANLRHNWAIQPITLKYSNSVGLTDFYNGLNPNVVGEDDFFDPLGDPNEWLFALAIEEITGIPAPKTKSATIGFQGELLETYDGRRVRRDIQVLAEPPKIK